MRLSHSRLPPSTSPLIAARPASAWGGPGRRGWRCAGRRPARTTPRRARRAVGSGSLDVPTLRRVAAPRATPAVLDLQMQLSEAQLHQVLLIQLLPSRSAWSGTANGLARLRCHRPAMVLQGHDRPPGCYGKPRTSTVASQDRPRQDPCNGTQRRHVSFYPESSESRPECP
jgi:hypothetical protein